LSKIKIFFLIPNSGISYSREFWMWKAPYSPQGSLRLCCWPWIDAESRQSIYRTLIFRQRDKRPISTSWAHPFQRHLHGPSFMRAHTYTSVYALVNARVVLYQLHCLLTSEVAEGIKTRADNGATRVSRIFAEKGDTAPLKWLYPIRWSFSSPEVVRSGRIDFQLSWPMGSGEAQLDLL